MKTSQQKTSHLAILRLIGVTALLGGCFIFALKDGIEKNKNTEATKAQPSSSRALFRRDVVEKIQTSGATLGQRSRSQVTTKLAGRFAPDDENLLIKQLIRAGYLYIFSYHHNADGSAVIEAMHEKQAIQPIVTIRVDKDGNATSKE